MMGEAKALAARGDYSTALEVLKKARDLRPAHEVELEIGRLLSDYVKEWHATDRPQAPPNTEAPVGDPASAAPLAAPQVPARAAGASRRVRLTLKSGRVLEGEVVSETKDEIVIRSKNGRLGVSREYIASVDALDGN